MNNVFKVGIVHILTALIALLLCTSVLSAQPVTQAQACHPWSEPIQITIRQGDRLSVGRLIQIVAEDLPSDVATSAAQSQEFSIPRLVPVAEGRLPSHGESVSALVATIYPRLDRSIRAAITAAVVVAINSARQDRVSMDESYNYCPVATAAGAIEHVPARGVFCDDGRMVRRAHRSRLLSDFHGDFSTGSFPIREDTTHPWKDLPGHYLHVFLRTGRSSELFYTMNVNRVYGPHNHPRPGAQLCRLLPSYLNGTTALPQDANGRTALLSNLLQLATIANAEGDRAAHDWVLDELKTFIPRIFDNAALGAREQETAQANQRTRDGEVRQGRAEGEKRRAKIETAQARRDSKVWGGLIVIMAALILAVFQKHCNNKIKAGLEQAQQSIETAYQGIEEKLKERFEEGKASGVIQLWNSLGHELQQLLDLAKVNVADHHPAAASLRAIQPHDLAVHVRAAPKTFFEMIHGVFASVLDGTSDRLRREALEENARLKTRVAQDGDKNSSLESLLTRVSDTIDTVSLACAGERAGRNQSLTAARIAEFKQMILTIIVSVREMTRIGAEEKEVSEATVVISEDQALQGKPLVDIMPDFKRRLRALHGEHVLMAIQQQEREKDEVSLVRIMQEAHKILLTTARRMSADDSVRRSLLGVSRQIDVALKSFIATGRNGGSHLILVPVIPFPSTSTSGSGNGSE